MTEKLCVIPGESREGELRAQHGVKATARRAQQKEEEKVKRRLDRGCLLSPQRREHSPVGRDASVMRPGTLSRNSGITCEIEPMKARSSVISTTKSLKKARKPQTTNDPCIQAIDQAKQAPQEKNKERAGKMSRMMRRSC